MSSYLMGHGFPCANSIAMIGYGHLLPWEETVSAHRRFGESDMKRIRSTALISLVCLVLIGCIPGCSLDPKKVYPGPERPKKDLALVIQTENLTYAPIYMRIRTQGETRELRVDDLGVVVLPGAYAFRAKLYHARLQEERRLAVMPVVPGQSDFPAEQTVMRWTRGDAPYKETDDTQLTVEAGHKYGVWCSDTDQIQMTVLGPYP